jgi:membrane-associated phospholipid phosphatase
MRIQALEARWRANQHSSIRRLTLSAVAVALGIGVALTAWIGSSAWGKRLDHGVEKLFAASGGSELYHHAYDSNVNVEHVVILACAISFVLAWLWWGPRRAILIVASVALAGALAELLKGLSLVPLHSAVPAAGSSWPSAHASSLTALDLSLLMLPWRQSIRWLVGLMATAYLVLICLSLMVVQAHQLTDLLGGCLTGASAFAFVAAVLDPWVSRPRLAAK